jgi:F-type H+-transporting ATPase subunit delta
VLRSRVAKRYARALFEIALEKKQLELVESDLKTLKKGYRESEEFRELVDSPIISNQAKKQIFTEVYQKRLQELTFKFMLLLIQKNREMLLMQVIDDLSDLSDQYHGILRGEVFSARRSVQCCSADRATNSKAHRPVEYHDRQESDDYPASR